MTARIKVIAFAYIRAISPILNPCTIHKNIPVTLIEYMTKDIDEVSFDFNTLITCGTNENVVKKAAITPITIFSSFDFLHIIFV
jgi:hypothetical protein